jgi:oligosaccharide repeat unit polymerase
MNFIFLILFVLAYLFIKKFQRPLSYVDIFFFVWLFVLVSIQSGFSVYKPSASTITIFYLTGICLFLGSTIVLGLVKPSSNTNYRYNMTRLKVLLYVILVFNVLANVEYLLRLRSAGIFDSELGLLSLRFPQTRELIEDESSIFFAFFGRCHYLYIPLAFFLYKHKKVSVIVLGLIILFAFIVNSIDFTRAPLLSVCIITATSYVLLIPISKRSVITMSSYGLIFFAFVTFVSNQIEVFVTKESTSGSDFQLYFFAGVKAFENILMGRYEADQVYHAFYSFDFINYPLKRLGLLNNYPSYVRKFSTAPPTNLYTYLDAFTLDFGIAGALIGNLILGMLLCFFYLRSRAQHLAYIIIYGSACYYTAMSPMNNEFIRFGFLIIILQAAAIHFIAREKLSIES